MPLTTVFANSLGISHKASNGFSIATIPDVCKTPSPGGPIPLPYPNFAQSNSLTNGTLTVKLDGGNMAAHKPSEYAISTGDEAGTVGGVTSNTFKRQTNWISFSFDVSFEGEGICRLADKKFHNNKNTVSCGGDFEGAFPNSVLAQELGQEHADMLCEAACECRSAPRPQDCMGARFTRENYTWRGNTPNTPGLYPEVSYQVGANGSLRSIVSSSGRTVMGHDAPASVASAMGQVSRAPGTSLRFDFIQLRDTFGGIGADNVRKFIEVKFPNETSFSANQHDLYRRMSVEHRKNIVLMSPEDDCACWRRETG
jgi:uncharacterized protein DUF4150